MFVKIKLSELVKELENNDIPRDKWRKSNSGNYEFMQTEVNCSGGILPTRQYIHIKTEKGVKSLYWLWSIRTCVETGAYGLEEIGFEDDLEATHNIINNPSHYTQGKIDCIDAIESATINKKGVEAVCVANIIKYLWRYENKNGIEDVKKAQWYLKRLIDALEIKERLLEKEKEVARVAEDFMRKHPTCLKCEKSCEENIKKCSSCKKNQPKEYREFLEQRLREKMNSYFIYQNEKALEEAFFYIKKLLGGD